MRIDEAKIHKLLMDHGDRICVNVKSVKQWYLVMMALRPDRPYSEFYDYKKDSVLYLSSGSYGDIGFAKEHFDKVIPFSDIIMDETVDEFNKNCFDMMKN